MYCKSERSKRLRLKLGAVAFIAMAVLALSTLAAASQPGSSKPDTTAMPDVIPVRTEQVSIVLSAADGYFPDGEVLSPFDMSQPAITNLDPELLDAVQEAALDAEADGVEMVITSGWRSKRYQQQLLDEAVVTYGSLAEARKWVNTPEKSTHVSGDAVDVGYTDADYWLIENGYQYGLCQTYANEIWHFELTVEPGDVCPAPRTDALAS